MFLRQTLVLAGIRVREMSREPEILFWVFGFPILLTTVLGLAFRGEGGVESRVALVEGAGADELALVLSADPSLDLERAAGREEALRRLRSGAVDAVADRGGALHVEWDPSREASELARLRVEAAVQRQAGRADPVPVDPHAVTEAGSRYVDFLVPGLLALALMSTTIWSVGFALVEARHRKLIKRFLATPMSRTAWLLSFVVARHVVLVVEIVALVLFACLLFGVPFRGSVAALGLVCLLGALSFSGLAVLLGSRSRTPEGSAGLINLTMMPMGLSSGVFFSYERFSPALQPVIEALPLRALSDCVRGIMLEGAGLAGFLPELALLGAWGVLPFLLGLFIFRWE